MTETTEVSLVFDFRLAGLDLSKSQHLTPVRWEQEAMTQTCIVILCWFELKTAKDEEQWLVGLVLVCNMSMLTGDSSHWGKGLCWAHERGAGRGEP